MSTDRTAERDTCLCTAYGCPLLGARSRSTTGGDFMCFVHFPLEAAQLQDATVEINRLAWLSRAIREIRMRSKNPAWRETYQRIDQDISLAQRNDLRVRTSESADQWALRLEQELERLVKATLIQEQQQAMDTVL